MTAGRRAVALRHEFRFGTRELIVFGGVIVVICALTFLFGVLVGREMVPAPRSVASVEPGFDGRARRGEPGLRASPARSDERLTFYRTLTAPSTADLPPIGKPTIEERIVPVDGPEPAIERQPPPPIPGSRSTPTAARATVSPPKPVARPPAPAAVSAAPVPAPPAPPASIDVPLWTVQVSSFRSRPLAEELRARLASRGLDVYVLSSVTEDGRVRYRVRVGGYATRVDAERVAADLRSERTLMPFVTPRTR